MSMVALILAAGLGPAALGDTFVVPNRAGGMVPRDLPCPPLGHRLVPVKDARPKLTVRRLGDMPKANHTLTVLRSVDGCAISSTVRYDAEGNGRAPRDPSR